MTPEEIKNVCDKERYDIDDLRAVFAYLRSERGCPWDREQTHETIRSNLIEETYEVIEAIDRRDAHLMREELGDLLLQVLFHSYIEEEAGQFTFDDVVSDITAKLVHRHPHVFGEVSAEGAAAALDAWEAAKKKEKTERRTTADALRAVPPSLPAVMRAQKLISKARRAGVDVSRIASGITDAAARVNDALLSPASGESAADAVADILFSAAGAADALKIDAEEALSRRSDAFIAECE